MTPLSTYESIMRGELNSRSDRKRKKRRKQLINVGITSLCTTEWVTRAMLILNERGAERNKGECLCVCT